MKIAYLLLVHNQPEKYRRLVNQLAGNPIFVHVDRKATLADFVDPRVILIEKRFKVFWGEYSVVAATLALMEHALSIRADYYVLLSGTDYRIQNHNKLENYLIDNKGSEFINILPMPNEKYGKSLDRFKFYNVQNRLNRRLLTSTIRRLNALFVKFNIKRNYKKHLAELRLFGGNTWWALSHEACKYVLAFANSHPNFIKLFKHSFAPDETLINTIVGNGEFRIKRSVIHSYWSQNCHPTEATDEHITKLARENYFVEDIYGKGQVFFLRKFQHS